MRRRRWTSRAAGTLGECPSSSETGRRARPPRVVGRGELRGNGRGPIISPSSHHSRCRRRRRADQIHPWSRFSGRRHGLIRRSRHPHDVSGRQGGRDVRHADGRCPASGQRWAGACGTAKYSTCPSDNPREPTSDDVFHHPRDPKPLTRSSLFLPPSFPQTLHRARASLASRPPRGAHLRRRPRRRHRRRRQRRGDHRGVDPARKPPAAAFHLAGGGSHAHDAAVAALATCGGGGDPGADPGVRRRRRRHRRVGTTRRQK